MDKLLVSSFWRASPISLFVASIASRVFAFLKYPAGQRHKEIDSFPVDRGVTTAMLRLSAQYVGGLVLYGVPK
jgi:hypothetical protein